MKMIKILQAVGLFLFLILAVSCRTSRPVYEERYPTREYPPYPGYPSYPPPPPPPPVVYGPNPKNLPPGQAKKIYGGRSAKPYAPGQRKKYGYNDRRYPLIIIRTPDIIIGRFNDGRYYYRNPDGLMYWRGYDNRFYLDEKYMDDIEYDRNEYDDWRYKGRKSDGYRDNNNRRGRN